MIVLASIVLTVIENIILIKICDLGGKKKYKFLDVFAIITLIIQLQLLNSSNYGTLAIFVPITTLLLYSFINIEGNTGTKVFYSLIGFLPISVISSIYLVVLTSQNVQSYAIDENLAVVSMLVSRISLFLLYLLLRYLEKINNVIKTNNWIILIFITTVSLFAITISLFSLLSQQFNFLFVILNICFIIIVNVFSILIYINLIKAGEYYIQNQMLEARLDSQRKAHIETQAVYEETRKLKHDLKNHILAITGSDNKLLEEYRKQLLEKLDFDEIPILDNIALTNILKAKNATCKELGIRLDIQLFHELDFMKDVDMISLFSNLIDNAIEAQKKGSINKRIIIRTKVIEENIVLEIKNSIQESVLKNNEELKTTKKDKKIHGYGLRSVKQVVKKYKGEVLFKEDEAYFSVICVFKIK